MKKNYIKVYKEPSFMETREKPTLLAEGEFKFVHWFIVDRGSFVNLGFRLPKNFEFDINKVPEFGSKPKLRKHLYIYENLVMNRDAFVVYRYENNCIKNTSELVKITTEICKYFIAVSLNKTEVTVYYTTIQGYNFESFNTIDGLHDKINSLLEKGATNIICKYN